MVLGLLVVVVLAAGGYELWYLNNVYNKVTKLHGTDKKASKHLAPQIPTSSQPITALMIGSDHRTDGATGKNGLSDTLMLARLDPKHHVISLLSIPRDLWVPSLGAKINSVYSTGGDNASLEAVEGVTGLKPNYLINVDFAGFQRLVDTLGGIYVNVDQYYYNPPEQSQYTGFSAIDIAPGYQRLKGADALAFSRYRHTDDDFHRQARQQMFLRAFQARASDRFHGISVTDIPFINDLLGAISDSVTIVGPGGKAPSPRTLLSFAATAYQARSHVVSIHLDWTPYNAPDGEAALEVTNLPEAISQWRAPVAARERRGIDPDGPQDAHDARLEAGGRPHRRARGGAERKRRQGRGRKDGHRPGRVGLPRPRRERPHPDLSATPGPTTARAPRRSPATWRTSWATARRPRRCPPRSRTRPGRAHRWRS